MTDGSAAENGHRNESTGVDAENGVEKTQTIDDSASDDDSKAANEKFALDDDNDEKNKPSNLSGSIASPPSAAERDQQQTMSQRWTTLVLHVHLPILRFVQTVTQFAASNPRLTIGSVTILSFGLLLLGFATNFNVDVDENTLWTPAGSLPIEHGDWIDDETKWSAIDPFAQIFFHTDGKNSLGHAEVARIFEVVDGIRALPSYNQICSQDDYEDPYNGANTCQIWCVTRFWNNSAAIFAETEATDEAVIDVISSRNFPEGTEVADTSLFGQSTRGEDGLLESTKSYFCGFEIPDLDDESERDLLTEIIDYVLEKRDEYQSDKNGFVFRGEIATNRSFSDEFERAILADLPLVPMVFIIMSIFTSLFFYRRHPVYSRSLLGISAVVSILLSIMSGFGLMFIFGVPFTSMSQLLPFVMFGIGLDDSFIIMGSFSRTDPKEDVLERLKKTVDDIGVAISLTSITSMLAFAIGCISTIPTIFWLCLYAFPTVLFVFAYQMTFFIACIVLDENRIQQKRRDCCVCCAVNPSKEDKVYMEESAINGSSEEMQIENERQEMYQRWMKAYSNFLLRPGVKAIVIVGFLAFAGLCAWSTTQLTQEFSFTEVVPDDSYLIDMSNAIEDYGVWSIFKPQIFFRNVDQSNSTIQDQMIDYVNEIVGMDVISNPPNYFWVQDFRIFVNATGIQGASFENQLDAFLANETYADVYSDLIERDESGRIFASKTLVIMDGINEKDVDQQIDTLLEQREISEKAPVNVGASEFAFFTYEEKYNAWEFYAVAVDELTLTTIIGIAVMSGIALIFVPHWTAVLFVAPMISLLYVDLMGVLQWGGVHINPVMYVCLVISIGLLVDFVLHMTLRYYECEGNRHEKTVKMLETMGISILVGGISTFLGTLPLALSTSSIFHTVFLAFLALVLLGTAHALILLPVILSLVGPEDNVPHINELLQKQASSKAPENGEPTSVTY